MDYFFDRISGSDGGSLGPLAAINDEPRQARKGATVIFDSCAEVRLLGLPPYRDHDL